MISRAARGAETRCPKRRGDLAEQVTGEDSSHASKAPRAPRREAAPVHRGGETGAVPLKSGSHPTTSLPATACATDRSTLAPEESPAERRSERSRDRYSQRR